MNRFAFRYIVETVAPGDITRSSTTVILHTDSHSERIGSSFIAAAPSIDNLVLYKTTLSHFVGWYTETRRAPQRPSNLFTEKCEWSSHRLTIFPVIWWDLFAHAHSVFFAHCLWGIPIFTRTLSSPFDPVTVSEWVLHRLDNKSNTQKREKGCSIESSKKQLQSIFNP